MVVQMKSSARMKTYLQVVTTALSVRWVRHFRELQRKEKSMTMAIPFDDLRDEHQRLE